MLASPPFDATDRCVSFEIKRTPRDLFALDNGRAVAVVVTQFMNNGATGVPLMPIILSVLLGIRRTAGSRP